MHTHVHLHHQVEEIVQWIESVRHCKKKANVLASGIRESAKS